MPSAKVYHMFNFVCGNSKAKQLEFNLMITMKHFIYFTYIFLQIFFDRSSHRHWPRVERARPDREPVCPRRVRRSGRSVQASPLHRRKQNLCGRIQDQLFYQQVKTFSLVKRQSQWLLCEGVEIWGNDCSRYYVDSKGFSSTLFTNSTCNMSILFSEKG